MVGILVIRQKNKKNRTAQVDKVSITFLIIRVLEQKVIACSNTILRDNFSTTKQKDLSIQDTGLLLQMEENLVYGYENTTFPSFFFSRLLIVFLPQNICDIWTFPNNKTKNKIKMDNPIHLETKNEIIILSSFGFTISVQNEYLLRMPHNKLTRYFCLLSLIEEKFSDLKMYHCYWLRIGSCWSQESSNFCFCCIQLC